MAVDAQVVANSLVELEASEAIDVITAVIKARPELAPAVANFIVPDLTFPSIKCLTDGRKSGAIKSFDPEKNFGFISCPELQEQYGGDVFVHGKQIGKGMGKGTPVNFAVMMSKDNKPQAVDIVSGSGNGGGGGVELGTAKISVTAALETGSVIKLGGSSGGGGTGGGFAGKGYGGGCGGNFDGGYGAGWGKAMNEMGKGGGFSPYDQFGFMGGKGDMGKGKRGKTPGGKADVQEELGTFTGTVKSYSEKSGYGFIDCPELKMSGHDNDVFLHHSQAVGLEVGTNVQFMAYLNKSAKPQAKDVVAL